MRGCAEKAIAVVVSAALYGVAFPPFGFASLSWVALVPLLLALRETRARTAAVLGAGWGFLATLFVIAWIVPTLHEHFERSLATSIGFWMGVSAVAAAPYIAIALAGYALAAARAPAALRPALFAAAWVSSEYARGHLGLGSPWASLGHAHATSQSLREIASVAGVYGLGALIAWSNAAAAETILALRKKWDANESAPLRSAAANGFGCALAVLAGMTYAGTRPAASDAAAGGLDVAVVQGNVDIALVWRQSTAGRVLRRYASLTRELLREEPRPALVLWPENAVQTTLEDPLYGPALLRMTRAGVPLLVGAPRTEERAGVQHHFNSAFLLRPDGRIEHYDKRRLLPFSESKPLGSLGSFETPGDLATGAYTPGNAPGVFDVAGERLGVLICMEAIYPELAREALGLGSTVLVNLSNDGWYRGRGGSLQHLHQAVFRAIETGLPLVRATTTGVSAVIAPDGSIVARTAEAEATTLRAALPARSTPPLYARTGDVFAWGCLAIWFLAAGRGVSWSVPGAARVRAVPESGRRATSRG